MDRCVEQLIALLEQTHAAYSRMLEMIEEEKEAAMAADIQRLSAAGVEKQMVVAQLKRLDRERMQALQRIATTLRVPFGQLRLSALAAHVDRRHHPSLQRLQTDLQAVLDKVRIANEECRTLVGHCLRLVRNTMGFFQHCLGTTETYGASGSVSSEISPSGRLLSGAI